MTALRIGDQTIRYDRDATVAAYAAIEQGDADRCSCTACKNFAAQRELAYPPEFRLLLDKLGIDASKEDEVFECGPVGDGRWPYRGWFYLVGEIVEAGQRKVNDFDDHCFGFFFTSVHPQAEACFVGPVIAIEFATPLKWVLADGS